MFGYIYLMISCGGIGEFGIPGECKQLGVVPYAIHAFFAVAGGQLRHQFYGNGVSFSPTWWLLIRRFLHHIQYLHN